MMSTRFRGQSLRGSAGCKSAHVSMRTSLDDDYAHPCTYFMRTSTSTRFGFAPSRLKRFQRRAEEVSILIRERYRHATGVASGGRADRRGSERADGLETDARSGPGGGWSFIRRA